MTTKSVKRQLIWLHWFGFQVSKYTTRPLAFFRVSNFYDFIFRRLSWVKSSLISFFSFARPRIIFTAIFVFFFFQTVPSGASQSPENYQYKLVMSRDRGVCEAMLRVFNTTKAWRHSFPYRPHWIDFSLMLKRPEFTRIRWERLDEYQRLAYLDINNDGPIETIVQYDYSSKIPEDEVSILIFSGHLRLNPEDMRTARYPRPLANFNYAKGYYPLQELKTVTPPGIFGPVENDVPLSSSYDYSESGKSPKSGNNSELTELTGYQPFKLGSRHYLTAYTPISGDSEDDDKYRKWRVVLEVLPSIQLPGDKSEVSFENTYKDVCYYILHRQATIPNRRK